ncbi:VCBS repeat-containing protein [Arenibacter sp. S6351L]|uniref:FG-GAP repeat domain-containing protein n=1 Tax=Arenibacter sp. S6351L TaxID=2926407 RepID=UPI001FF15A37|nr:VCBS repeat-containing protein [Arenibacter sp. S6351L]MCK0136234.1 FG-GAP-like repeat-containing protein [Arenibacter sp. S6351L]
MKNFFSLTLLLGLLFSCSGNKKELQESEFKEIPATNLSGNQLAEIHCASCHLFVKPDLLPKSSWQNDVLPAMGHRLGIYKGNVRPDSLFDNGRSGEVVKKANIFPERPLIAQADWNKIVDYYLNNAPDTILAPKRANKIKMGLKHFKYRESAFSHTPALTSMVKILPENRGVVFADSKRNINSLTFLTKDLEKDFVLGLKMAPVHYYERYDTIYLTTAGKNIFPNDVSDGALQKIFTKGTTDSYTSNEVIPNLQRPVNMAYGDLNNDGLEDVVACEYGNETGKLVWYENNGGDKYTMRMLDNRSGAITAVIKDANGDGLQDIFVLMAQGDEGVVYYQNQGDGTFSSKRLLSFLPLNGSQYIELVDFNGDGFDDILYVCGDNADKTPILKDYHGIYVFLNDGNLNFEQSFFYHLNGAYKAMPRDYDLDGDLDIAAISFFPDYMGSPEESFVYLENKGDMKFEDYSFPESFRGRWIVMDAEDMDADGDIDLALGSFVYFLPLGDTTGLGQKWLSNGPSIIVLENTTK